MALVLNNELIRFHGLTSFKFALICIFFAYILIIIDFQNCFPKIFYRNLKPSGIYVIIVEITPNVSEKWRFYQYLVSSVDQRGSCREFIRQWLCALPSWPAAPSSGSLWDPLIMSQSILAVFWHWLLRDPYRAWMPYTPSFPCLPARNNHEQPETCW